jgi:hypothetical protein
VLHDHRYTRVEFDWVASDADGLVGYFSTGGAGPIPKKTLDDADALSDILEQLLVLPVVSSATAVGNILNPPDWIEVGRRGIFAYDWDRMENVYRLIALPVAPIRVGAISNRAVGQLVLRIKLRTRFAGASDVLPSADYEE